MACHNALVKSSNLPSFDTFIGFVQADDLSLILRSHIALEAALNKIIEMRATPNQGNDLDRLGFMAKVDVSIALGALDPAHRGAWAMVNRIRNGFAHDLEASITARQAADLRAQLGWSWFPDQQARELYLRVFGREPEAMGTAQAIEKTLPHTPRHRVAFYCGLLYIEAFVATRLPDSTIVPELRTP
jgi:hypothetical protein